MKTTLPVRLLAVALLLVACDREATTNSHIEITPAIKTRVTGLFFDNGDAIGLTVQRTADTYLENQKLTYNGTTFTAEGLIWYNNLNEKSTLIAYYPYQAAGAPTTFRVASDQSSGTESSDLLVAVKSDVAPAATPVAMTFYHLFSQLSVLVTNQSDATVTGITIGGFATAATVDLAQQSVTATTGTTAEVTPYTITAGTRYQAILIPQQTELVLTVETSDGKTHSKSLSATLVSGRRYDLPVTLTNIDISLSLNGEIGDWVSGGELGGSTAASTITYEGVEYPVVTIGGKRWLAANLRYLPTSATVGNGIAYPNGSANQVTTLGLLYNYATAATGSVENGVLRGICPEGWHLPSADEWTALIAREDLPADFLTAAGYWSATNSGEYHAGVGRMMSATRSESSTTSVMMLAFGADETAIVKSINAANHVSVRCVGDE